MPSPPQGPNDRRFQAEPPSELPDEHAATVPAPSGPPPLPLIRRKVQAEGAPLPGAASWQRAAPVTAPWPTPPSSRTPREQHTPNELQAASEEGADASTPFASAIDIFEEDSRATESPEPEPDFRAGTNPWWRRLKAPSRQLRTGALVAALAAAVGWSAGAKPWASHRVTTKVAAAKPGAHPAAKHAPAAHGAQGANHANRRVAVNATKAKPAAAAPAHAKASAKPTAAKPAANAKPTQRALAKTATNKATNKAPAKAKPASATPGKKSALAAKAKSANAKRAATKAKAH